MNTLPKNLHTSIDLVLLHPAVLVSVVYSVEFYLNVYFSRFFCLLWIFWWFDLTCLLLSVSYCLKAFVISWSSFHSFVFFLTVDIQLDLSFSCTYRCKWTTVVFVPLPSSKKQAWFYVYTHHYLVILLLTMMLSLYSNQFSITYFQLSY